MTLQIAQPYLIYIGDETRPTFAKTALGLRDWVPELCVGELVLSDAALSTGLARLQPAEAVAAGAQSLVIGVASRGGALLPQWKPQLIEALEAGLDIVSGLHDLLRADDDLVACANRLGRRLIDVRVPPAGIPIANGRRRTGKRLLTVGTDCALGKKYTALVVARAIRSQGLESDFRATGQTGIMIAGSGIPIDAVVSDFVAGAAEILTPDADPEHWDIVEGQGSIFHPSYAGVSLGLLHGTQPDVLILCHEAGRRAVAGLEDFALPSLKQAIELHLQLARRTNPDVRCAGVALNTGNLSEDKALVAIAECARQLSLPVADPLRPSRELDRLVASCLT